VPVKSWFFSLSQALEPNKNARVNGRMMHNRPDSFLDILRTEAAIGQEFIYIQPKPRANFAF
jgi:hypothetical protein